MVLIVLIFYGINDEVQSYITSALGYILHYTYQHYWDIEVDIGSYVWLHIENLQLPLGLFQKLLAPWVRPYHINAQISLVVYKLYPPASFSRLHPVFYASLLKPHHEAIFPHPALVYYIDYAVKFEVKDGLQHCVIGCGQSYHI